MAIDDNTVYGLTGAQVKELPEKINEVKGLAKILTTADYNANSSDWSDTDPANFNCVALWKLEPGIYTSNSTNENSVTIAVCNVAIYSQSSAGEKVYIVGKMGNYGRPIMVFNTYSGTEMGRIYQVSGHIGFPAVSISRPVDGLSSADSSLSLSAAQGKVLNDKIGGDLSNLTTTDKSSLINAINELVTSVDSVTLRVLGEDETYSVSTSAWTALTGKTPYNYSTDLTATHIIGVNTIVELLNTDPVTFANNGIVIGEINGQTVTIYSVGVPVSNLSLKINYKER